MDSFRMLPNVGETTKPLEARRITGSKISLYGMPRRFDENPLPVCPV